MFKPRHDELRSYLEWRRQTRFIRRHGGPIMAFTLFVLCIWFVWRACHTRPETIDSRVEESRAKDIDHYLQASKLPRW